MSLLSTHADPWAATTVAAVRRKYPNALRHVLSGPDDNPTPRQVHPAFYGCFDWHSAVEMHWALIELRPHLSPSRRAEVDEVLNEHLTPANLDAETDYFRVAPAFERPYGWGWALALADAAATMPWGPAMRPLADTITEAFLAWLPGESRPNRQGAHANSAFALTRAWPWAERLRDEGRPELAQGITAAARRWFGNDRDCPAAWEPGAADFLSPALAEADLMSLVLAPDAFRLWLEIALPDLAGGGPRNLFRPVTGIDGSDGQGAHLFGLNLHRAAALRGLQRRLGPSVVWERAAQAHVEASLPAVSGSHWMAEHWLAAFAVLAERA